MTHLWRDPDSDQYGVARVERDDGTYADYCASGDDVKPDQIDSTARWSCCSAMTPTRTPSRRLRA